MKLFMKGGIDENLYMSVVWAGIYRARSWLSPLGGLFGGSTCTSIDRTVSTASRERLMNDLMDKEAPEYRTLLMLSDVVSAMLRCGSVVVVMKRVEHFGYVRKILSRVWPLARWHGTQLRLEGKSLQLMSMEDKMVVNDHEAGCCLRVQGISPDRVFFDHACYE